MSKVKIDIISGFLGAGKTTLIKKILEERNNSEKTVIIENEFGEVGIDGNILKDSGLEIKEITTGCICCSLIGELKDYINEIIDKFKPDNLIIEPSGIGKLSEITKSIKESNREDIEIRSLITVVDPLNFEYYYSNFGDFYIDQIKTAKIIILSRIQKIKKENLNKIILNIKEINPQGTIIDEEWDKLSINRIYYNIKMEKGSISKENLENEFIKNKNKNPFQNWGITLNKKYSKEKLQGILNNLELNNLKSDVIRAKGIVESIDGKWLSFQYVKGEHLIKNAQPLNDSRISVIGKNLDNDELLNLFD